MLHGLQELFELVAIRSAQGTRFAQHLWQALQTLKQRGILKWKIEFCRVQYMKQDHLVPPVPKMF